MDAPAVKGSVAIREEHHNGKATNEQAFLVWLRENGAIFDSVKWPSLDTATGVRGAVARRDIVAGEHMVVIPHRLMMSEFHAKADPDLGHVHRDNAVLLKSDKGLAVYIMQEMLKGESSFYWPYLRVLPAPRNLRHWSETSLLDLHDHKLARKTAAIRRQLYAQYNDMMGALSSKYPHIFPADQYTFELFDFAWSTVQARAFGKRLKCSALVPFADCLNHGNVQTKYDFDVDGNGLFRLFPSGTNHYPRCAEVRNSYGRRANDNLLLDYGFAMLGNQWDTAEVACSLSPHETLFARRKACLRASGQRTLRFFPLRYDTWSVEPLRFNRCACLVAPELDKLEAEHEVRSGLEQQGSGVFIATTGKDSGGGGSRHDKRNELRAPVGAAGSLPFSLELHEESSDRRGRIEVEGEEAMKKKHNNDEGRVMIASGVCFPCRALSVENEQAVLTEIILLLLEARDAFPTTLEHDEYALRKAHTDATPELFNALTYRVTIKRILAKQLDMSERAIGFVQYIAKELDSAGDRKNAGEVHSCPEPAAFLSAEEGPSIDQQCSINSTFPQSFVFYLADLKKELLHSRPKLLPAAAPVVRNIKGS